MASICELLMRILIADIPWDKSWNEICDAVKIFCARNYYLLKTRLFILNEVVKFVFDCLMNCSKIFGLHN